jgi:hypothetical protein
VDEGALGDRYLDRGEILIGAVEWAIRKQPSDFVGRGCKETAMI